MLPDLEPLVYSASTLSTIPPNKRQDWQEMIREGVVLAKFLDRIHNRWVLSSAAPRICANALMVLQQFDSALDTLNPNPSIEEVVARVRAYREWFCVIHCGIERARVFGEDMGDTDRQFNRAIGSFEQKYGALFSQDFRHCDPSSIPPLPEAPPAGLPMPMPALPPLPPVVGGPR
jgi:hypothetical protein